jgi:SAM-dependent methyltransferase
MKHIPKGSKILDLGCGFNGNLLNRIKTDIREGFGLDISINTEHKDEIIHLEKHDLNQPLPFEDCTFDIATSLANLEHLENPQNSIKEIFRALKPGGVLLLTTPSIYGKPVLEFLAYLRLVSKQEIEDHKNYFNKKILLDLCKETGFSFSKHQYFQFGMNNFLIARK